MVTELQPHPKGWAVLKQLPARIKRHNVVVTAAGIAFYGLLALVPTLIATVSIYGLVNEGNEDEIKQQIQDAASSLDASTATFVEDQLVGITTSDSNLLALIIGIVLALFSASGAVQKLMGTVSVAYEAIETRPGWKLRLLAYLFTVGSIVGVVMMVGIVGVVPAVLDRVDLSGPATAAIQILQFPAFAVLFVVALTILYRYGPDRSPRTPWRNPGAWVAAGLWVLFAVAFSVYSSRIGAMPASYGLLGTIAALMIFLQLTALAVIVGAEYNGLVEHLQAPAEEDPTPPPEPLSLAKATAGLAALFILGRNGGA